MSTITYIFLSNNFGVQIIPFKLEKLNKEVIEGKIRYILACTKPVTRKLCPFKRRLDARFFMSKLFNIGRFVLKMYIKFLHSFETLYLSSVTVKSLASSWRKIYFEAMK